MLRTEYLNHTQKGYLEGKIELKQHNGLQIFLKRYQIHPSSSKLEIFLFSHCMSVRLFITFSYSKYRKFYPFMLKNHLDEKLLPTYIELFTNSFSSCNQYLFYLANWDLSSTLRLQITSLRNLPKFLDSTRL